MFKRDEHYNDVMRWLNINFNMLERISSKLDLLVEDIGISTKDNKKYYSKVTNEYLNDSMKIYYCPICGRKLEVTNDEIE